MLVEDALLFAVDMAEDIFFNLSPRFSGCILSTSTETVTSLNFDLIFDNFFQHNGFNCDRVNFLISLVIDTFESTFFAILSFE